MSRVLRDAWTTRRVVLGTAAIYLGAHYVVSIGIPIGPSMLPTLDVQGDCIVVSKLHVRGRGVKVGDIVSFWRPQHPGTRAVKRVLGMPGDFVLRDTPETGTDQMIQVPEGHCWVVGDNLPSSLDSRDHGPIPLALIRGKAVLRIRGWTVTRLENSLQRPA